MTKIISESQIIQEDKIWSKYSNDKVDIGQTLAYVIRTLNKAFPLSKPLRALSIGSSKEPQFRILQSAFQGGLYLLDIDKAALAEIQERIHRQNTDHVFTILNNYNKEFLDRIKTQQFLKKKLGGKRVDLITLQHSMYYSPRENWYPLIRNLWSEILAPKGAIYCVLMSSRAKDPDTTTWLYNHFAGKFFGHKNDQDLFEFKQRLERDAAFKTARIVSKTSRVQFFVEDFQKFMDVVWMILLYPEVHRYTPAQRREISEYIRKNFFSRKKPLIQCQDHLAIYRRVTSPAGLP